MAKKSTYDASSISVLEGLEAVRKRPGMYIGSVSRKGLNHLIYEIVDNSVDEHLAGYCDRIEVTLEKDGSATSQRQRTWYSGGHARKRHVRGPTRIYDPACRRKIRQCGSTRPAAACTAWDLPW